MRSAYKFLTICTVVSILVCAFCIPVSAALEGSPYRDVYIPVCPKYSYAELLPFGQDDTVVIYYHRAGASDWYWWFFDNRADSTIVQSYNAEFNNTYTGFYFDHQGANSSYDRIRIYSMSPIILVRMVFSAGTYTYTSQTFNNLDTSFNVDLNSGRGSVRYKYENNSTVYKNTYNREIVCSRGYFYMGHGLDYLIDDYSSSWGTASDYVSDYFIGTYPDTIKEAIDSIGDNSAALENYYNGIQNTLDTMSGNIARMHNDIGELQSQLDTQAGAISQVNNNVSSAAAANQSAVSSAAAENSSVVGQAASDILNAGEGTTFNNDTSEVAGIISKLDEWNSELESFADDMDESISGVSTALDNGTTLFERFVGAAPAGLAALIAFALVWFVVRKIIGR